MRNTWQLLKKRKDSHNPLCRKFEDFSSFSNVRISSWPKYSNIFSQVSSSTSQWPLIRLSHGIERGTATQVSLRRRATGTYKHERRLNRLLNKKCLLEEHSGIDTGKGLQNDAGPSFDLRVHRRKEPRFNLHFDQRRITVPSGRLNSLLPSLVLLVLFFHSSAAFFQCQPREYLDDVIII